MKCSICDYIGRQQLVYCRMCDAWHCAEHFNSALITSPGRLLRSPLIVHGHIDVHGPVAEAVYKDVRHSLSVVGSETHQVVSRGRQIIGAIELSTDVGSPWKAYALNNELVDQRETRAGAVGCVLQAFLC